MKALLWRLEWLAYTALAGFLRLLGFRRSGALGGWLLRRIGPRTGKQRIVLRNLQLAFPDADHAQLSRDAWENMGRTFAEFPVMHRLGHIEVENAHILEDQAERGPAIVVTGHFSNWEVMAAALARSPLDVAITYRRLNNPVLDRTVVRQRSRYGTRTLVPKSGPAGARHLLTELKEGRSVALLNDQKFNTGLPVPFFGHDAMTATGPTRLAMQTGAPILMLSCTREPDGYRVRVWEPWHPDSVESGVQRIVDWTEARIIEAPAQWFWAHRRWPKPLYSKSPHPRA